MKRRRVIGKMLASKPFLRDRRGEPCAYPRPSVVGVLLSRHRFADDLFELYHPLIFFLFRGSQRLMECTSASYCMSVNSPSRFTNRLMASAFSIVTSSQSKSRQRYASSRLNFPSWSEVKICTYRLPLLRNFAG